MHYKRELSQIEKEHHKRLFGTPSRASKFLSRRIFKKGTIIAYSIIALLSTSCTDTQKKFFESEKTKIEKKYSEYVDKTEAFEIASYVDKLVDTTLLKEIHKDLNDHFFKKKIRDSTYNLKEDWTKLKRKIEALKKISELENDAMKNSIESIKHELNLIYEEANKIANEIK